MSAEELQMYANEVSRLNMALIESHRFRIEEVTNAVLAERERCVRVCGDIEDNAWQIKGTTDWSSYNEGISDGAGKCLEAIRALDEDK